MQRSAATVICLVGPDADALHASIRAANVSVVTVPAEGDPLDRAVAATRAVAGRASPYVVHDADPLAAVADAWVRLFDEQGPIGEVEVAVAETLARARAGTIELPDYYLVTGIDGLRPTWRHWYFGVLHEAAPRRVVPAPTNVAALVASLATLAASRWWPPVERLLAGIERRAPDLSLAAGPPGPESTAVPAGPAPGHGTRPSS